MRVKAVPRKLVNIESEIRAKINDSGLQVTNTALWHICAVLLIIEGVLKREAAFIAAIEGVDVGKRHWALAARMMGL